MSDLASIKQFLIQEKPALMKKYHVSSIGLFSSIVRDDFTPASDIDIIVEFSQPVGIEFIHLGDYLEKKLKRKVDLVSKRGVKEKYLKIFESEIIYV